MKITSVEGITVDVPFTQAGPPSGFGGETWNTLACLLVKVETDEGIVGWGETFGYNCIPAARTALETMVAPHAVGLPADDIAGTMDRLQVIFHLFGRYGVTLFALSGLEIALWDIAGKQAGKPLHALLGGTDVDSLPSYASLFKYIDPQVTASVSAAARESGYERIKLHEDTMAPILSARDAIGPETPLMVDVNCSWRENDLPDLIGPLKSADLLWLEEPIWPPENFPLLADTRDARLPLASGENLCTVWQFQHMLDAQAVDYTQPSVTKVGGVAEFAAVCDATHAADTAVAPHSPYFGPGFLASLHLIATKAPEAYVERLFVNLEADLFGGLTVPDGNGRLKLPQGPGLGCDPDPELVARYRVD